MKTIILRDDDVSYFTQPSQLEKIYGRLWAANIPVSFAVIPQPRGDVRVLHRPKQPYDPSIPPQHRGNNRPYKLVENQRICQFLNEMARQGLVEICLHGFQHSYYEFESDDDVLLSQKIEQGKMELESIFTHTEIKTFIAPYDRLSPTAFNLLLDYGFNICTNTGSLKATPYKAMPAFAQRDLENEQKLYTCDEYFFSHDSSPEASLSLAKMRLAAHDFLIVTNHYWTFYYDWVGNWDAMQAAWQEYVDLLLASKAKFSGFS